MGFLEFSSRGSINVKGKSVAIDIFHPYPADMLTPQESTFAADGLMLPEDNQYAKIHVYQLEVNFASILTQAPPT